MQWPGLFASYAPHFNSCNLPPMMAYPSHPAVALFNPQWPPQPSPLFSSHWQQPPPPMISTLAHPWLSPAQSGRVVPYYYQPAMMSWPAQQPPKTPMLYSSEPNHAKQSNVVSHAVTRPVEQRPLDVSTPFGSLPTYATIGIPKVLPSSPSANGQHPGKLSQNTSRIHHQENYPKLTPNLYQTIPD